MNAKEIKAELKRLIATGCLEKLRPKRFKALGDLSDFLDWANSRRALPTDLDFVVRNFQDKFPDLSPKDLVLRLVSDYDCCSDNDRFEIGVWEPDPSNYKFMQALYRSVAAPPVLDLDWKRVLNMYREIAEEGPLL